MMPKEGEKECGWLSVSGEFIGCEDGEHEDIAEFYLKKTSSELEETGWVKCLNRQPFSNSRNLWWWKDKRLTEPQRAYLMKNGFIVMDDD